MNADFDVHECLACADEYGVSRSDFKGRRIARIRKYEMNQAAKVYGTDQNGNAKITLHWFPYIDGHVPFNAETVACYRDLFIKLKPDITFGPDGFFPIDTHPDHVNTGKNYYFALKSLDASQRPKKMLFYQSYASNFHLPYQDRKIVYLTRIAHKSQLPPVLMKIFTLMDSIWKRSLVNGGRKVDKFRIVTFNSIDHIISENSHWFLKFKRIWWEKIITIGEPGEEIFKNPPVETILQDYHKNGWV